MVYNMLTCGGFDLGIMGGCSLSWLIFGLLIFVVLISRKQLGENLGFPYNLISGFVGSLVPYILIITFSGSVKWGLVVGIIGSLAGGFIGSQFLGSSEGGIDYGYE